MEALPVPGIDASTLIVERALTTEPVAWALVTLGRGASLGDTDCARASEADQATPSTAAPASTKGGADRGIDGRILVPRARIRNVMDVTGGSCARSPRPAGPRT